MTDQRQDRQPVDARAQAVAEEVGVKLSANDATVQSLGITLDTIGPGHARLKMTVRADMINGAGICHGGMITTLGDAAFAFACNSYNTVTLATAITVEFIASANEGDRLTATASETSRTGRTGIYDVVVKNQHEVVVAVLRGRCQEIRGRHVL